MHPEAVKSELKWIIRRLRVAREVSTWSKDPSTKVGAVIYDKDGVQLSQGYNGLPRGIQDDERINNREWKLPRVQHAELNCITNAARVGARLLDSELYVYGLPVCNHCAGPIIQAGIKKIFMCVPENIRQAWADSYAISKEMFDEVGITTEMWQFHHLDM